LRTATHPSHHPVVRAGAHLARVLAATLLAIAMVVGSVTAAMAAGLVVVPASGGTAINDTTGGSGGSYTSLGDIVFDEDAAGQIGLGTLVLKTPAGFDWRTTTSVQVVESDTSGSNNHILLSSNPASCSSTSTSVNVIPTASTITVRVCRVSGDSGKLTFNNPDVRPTAQTPLASGNIYLDDSSTATVANVTKGAAGTNLGSLAMVATAATKLQVSGLPSPYTTQSSQSVTVTALSAPGNRATSYVKTVRFTSTDPAATLPANYTFTAGDAGAHTFTGVTVRTLGLRTVTATDTQTSSINGTQSGINVVAAAATNLVVSGIASSGQAGTVRSVTVTARDQYGNTATGYQGTVRFSSSDAQAVLPADYTFTAADAGTRTFTGGVTLKTVGTHSVTATDTATSSITGNQSAIGVTAAALDHLVLSPASATVAAGASQAYTATGFDAYGNNLGNVTAQATFDIGPNGACTGASCSATTAGVHTVTATYQGKTGSAELQVVPAAAAQVSVGLDPSSLSADGSSTALATVTVTDAYGNVRADDSVALASSGDAAIGAVTNNHDGTYSAVVTASTTAGDETITATDGSASGSATLHEITPLAVTSAGPASRGQGANGGAYGQSITVLGSGFVAGTSADFGPGVTTKFTTFVDGGKLTAHIVVAEDAAVGTRNVTVTIPGGGTATLADGFTVNAGPKLVSVSPSAMPAGSVKTVTLTGANFSASTKVTFPGNGVAVTSVALVDAEHLTVGLSSASGAAVGPRDVLVTNADAGSGVCTGCISVTATPKVTGMNPSVLGPGAQRTVSLTGENFVSGAKVAFAGSGVAATQVTYVSANQLDVTVSVASSAPAGARTVTVTNPDGGKGSCATCFSVSAGPALVSASPNHLVRSSTQTVTVSGSGFQAGASMAVSNWVLVSNVTVVDSSTIQATVTVPATTALGSRTVTVTNPDGGRATATLLSIDS
jgi:Invasin, domain 3/IPT/TIG domain